MSRASARSKRQDRRKKQKLRSNLTWGGVGLLVLAVAGLLVFRGLQPLAGESVPIQVNSGNHINTNVPPTFSTDPPTSGPHYGSSLPAGFYTEADLADLPPNPEAFLVHNLEHGYVVLWYNCTELDESGCAQLEAQIQAAMAEVNGSKVLAFPWSTADIPLVMTSWGQIQRLAAFDADLVDDFIRTNRNRSPEPNAP